MTERRCQYADAHTRANQLIAALQAEVEALKADARRLDWLELQVVEIRTPLRYGSRRAILSAPEGDEEIGPLPSDIRAAIDAAMKDKP